MSFRTNILALATHIVRTTLLSLLLLANYARSQQMTQASAIVTDRPDVTESSIVVPKRSLQFENGITWTISHDVGTVDFTETLVRFGLTTRAELRLVIPNYMEDVTGYIASGFNDIAVGAKRQLGPLRGDFDLSVIAGLSLPTGANRISSHGFDPFIKFPWSKDLAKGWSFGGMESFFWNTVAGRRDLIWEPTLMAEKELFGSWSVFVEYAGDFAQHGGSKQIAHFGTTYRVTSKQQIDCHFGFGISPTAPGYFLAIGYSIRLDDLMGAKDTESNVRHGLDRPRN